MLTTEPIRTNTILGSDVNIYQCKLHKGLSHTADLRTCAIMEGKRTESRSLKMDWTTITIHNLLASHLNHSLHTNYDSCAYSGVSLEPTVFSSSTISSKTPHHPRPITLLHILPSISSPSVLAFFLNPSSTLKLDPTHISNNLFHRTLHHSLGNSLYTDKHSWYSSACFQHHKKSLSRSSSGPNCHMGTSVCTPRY